MGICISSLLKSLVRKGFFVLIGVVALAGLTTPAQATPVTYTFSGDAGGYVNSVSNNFSGAFTLVVNADTTAIDLSGPPYSRLNNVNGTFTEGSYSATLTGVTIVANADPSFQNIDFYNAAFNNGLGLSDPALNGYNLTKSIGPITVTSSGPLGSFLTPTFGGGGFATTGGDTLYLTSNDSLTFTSSVGSAPVPEPCTFFLLGAGLSGIGFLRRRIRS